jgi:1-deoxy-D-xylulose-5-phosphate synthase
MLHRTLREGHPVLTVEDHIVTGGFGAAVTEFARDAGLPTRALTVLGHPADALVAHAKRCEQLAEIGLDVEGLVSAVRRAVRLTTKVEVLDAD